MLRLAIATLLLSVTLLAADDASAGLGFQFNVNVQSNIGDGDISDASCDVDEPNPGDQCTLRAAIQESNNEPTVDAIHFNLTGLLTLPVATELPGITDTVNIDGTTQPNCPDPPCVALDGSLTTVNEDGLNIAADNVTIRGLAIHSFHTNGIFIQQGADGNTIAGNHIGTDVGGMTDLGNGSVGVTIFDGSNNTIGGSSAADRNVIIGNQFGAQVSGMNAGGNVVLGNYIGVGADGETAVPNSLGVFVRNLPTSGRVATFGSKFVPSGTPVASNVIGPDNVISGNTNMGICICEASNTTVIGNLIGTDASGQNAVPNGTDGIEMHGNSNIIGGTSAAARNIISGNGDNGIEVSPDDLANAVGNVISGNYIGTNATGNSAIPNGTMGIQLTNTEHTIIGGDTSAARNVISGNGNSGIHIASLNSLDEIAGNYIGTNASGEGAVANVVAGIFVAGTTSELDIQDNVISGNDNTGVHLAANTTGVTVMANRIGVSPSGDPLGNTNHGVFIRDSSGHQVGDVTGGANIIANNGGNGVLVTTDGGVAVANTIRGNSIHTNNLKGVETAGGGNLELAPPAIDPPPPFGMGLSGTACANCTVDIYSDDVDEGRVYEGTTTASAGGTWTFNEEVAGPFSTATATDAAGNTSEFSAPVTSPQPPTPTPTASASPSPSQSATTPTPTPADGDTRGGRQPTSPPVDLRWGDHNCSGPPPDAVDSLLTLRHDAGLPAETNDCPEFGTAFFANSQQLVWGDIDCDGEDRCGRRAEVTAPRCRAFRRAGGGVPGDRGRRDERAVSP